MTSGLALEYNSGMTTTDQVATTHPNGSLPNPTGKGGFGDNPQNRNPGGWNKEESISYQYNKLMRLSPEDLQEFKPETVAQAIALKRLTMAITNDGLGDTKEVTDRTEGRAAQSIDLTTLGDKINVALVEFVDSGSNQDSDKTS